MNVLRGVSGRISIFPRRFSRLWRIALLGLLGFAGIPAVLAAKIPDLYEAEIPVLSQSRADRHVAIQQAFAEVLVRVSGQQDIVLALPPLIETDAVPFAKTPNQEQPALVLVGKTTEIAAALNQATYYVKQFRYQKPTGKPHIDWGIKPVEDKNAKKKPVRQAQQVILIRFNKKKVNKLLHDSGFPVWGKTRPSILVWIVVESRGKRYLLSNTIKSTTREAIEKHARLYGLPVRFPLMDLADRANISISDVWGNFADRIMDASKRYQTESILVGKLYIANRTWNTQWSLYIDGRRVSWQDQDVRLENIVKLGLSHTAQNLSRAFADVQTEQGIQQILVEIKALTGLAEYVEAEKYLSSLSAVKKVQAIKFERDSAIFKLTTQGSRIGVMQAISLGTQLAAEPNTVPKSAGHGLPGSSQKMTGSTETAQPVDTDRTMADTFVKLSHNKAEKLVPDLIYRFLK